MVTADKLKAYLRIDSDYEDELLKGFLTTAGAYLTGAVSSYSENYSAYPEFAGKADLLQMVLAAELYQNRDNSPHDMSYTVRSLMTQLQYFTPAEGDTDLPAEVDTGSQTVDDAEVATDDEADEYLDGIFGNADGYGNSSTVADDAVATDDETNELFDSIFGGLG